MKNNKYYFETELDIGCSTITLNVDFTGPAYLENKMNYTFLCFVAQHMCVTRKNHMLSPVGIERFKRFCHLYMFTLIGLQDETVREFETAFIAA